MSELPSPAKIVGFPSPDGQQVYVSKSDMAELAAYIQQLHVFIHLAKVCLEADN